MGCDGETGRLGDGRVIKLCLVGVPALQEIPSGLGMTGWGDVLMR